MTYWEKHLPSPFEAVRRRRLERQIEGGGRGLDWERIGPIVAGLAVMAVFVTLMLTVGRTPHVSQDGCTIHACSDSR